MRIKSIAFHTAGKGEGTTCDCCGKYITNICSITADSGERFNFGSTCFEKRIKGNFTGFQKREINRALKSIQIYEDGAKHWEAMTEERYAVTNADTRDYGYPNSPFQSFDEMKKWYLEVFYPNRIEDEKKTLNKYRILG